MKIMYFALRVYSLGPVPIFLEWNNMKQREKPTWLDSGGPANKKYTIYALALPGCTDLDPCFSTFGICTFGIWYIYIYIYHFKSLLIWSNMYLWIAGDWPGFRSLWMCSTAVHDGSMWALGLRQKDARTVGSFTVVGGAPSSCGPCRL